MKLHIVKKGIYSTILCALASSSAFADHTGSMGSAPVTTPGKFYLGVFGGEGSTRGYNVSQFGSAYFFEALGGALAVNGFGDTNSRSAWLLGLQGGYQAPQIIINPQSQWAIVPAAEMEGYYLEKTTFSAYVVNDEATRLPLHDFEVSYQLRRSVFLANAILNLNIPCVRVHPYLGVGIGGAVVKLSNAESVQVLPPEPGVNHFNASTSDTAPTFAGQIKAGLSYDINDCIALFAEYRWLYLSSTHFTLGSTVFPGHAVTSSWQFKLNPQYTNMGTIGIRFSI
jgi:opacity protein-like surface antigen